MPEESVDLLSVDRGTVTAPAGCGKTHLISEAVKKHGGPKPILVLTHTNAGVAALRNRFKQSGISSRSYSLSTLDGLAMRLAGNFPVRSGIQLDVLKLENPRSDYPAIRRSICTLLQEGHIQDILRASYARMIVDEYQDCCREQHVFISYLASALPTCILGDPLQAVFTWTGLPDWEAEVCGVFPIVAELNIPWRWRNAGAEDLGIWLLECRKKLIKTEPIDFEDSPEEVSWVKLEGNASDCRQSQLTTARVTAPASSGSVLIIGNGRRPREQRRFASQIPGAVAVENVDLGDLIGFAQAFDFKDPDALSELLNFASLVMRNVRPSLVLKRINSLERGTARIKASDAEAAALRFKNDPCPENAVDLLVEINKDEGVSSHRPVVLRACIRSLNSCSYADDGSFYDAAICAREQNRVLGRSLPKRAVGSTLLLKGLEGDVSVILNAADHDAKSLYVAMTRGARKLYVCSYDSVWNSHDL